MPRFAANLTMLFTEVPFLDRFALARKAVHPRRASVPYAFRAEDVKAALDQEER